MLLRILKVSMESVTIMLTYAYAHDAYTMLTYLQAISWYGLHEQVYMQYNYNEVC